MNRDLWILSGGSRRYDLHARGVENQSLDFRFGALGRDFLTIPDKSDPGGVAHSQHDLARGAHSGVRGGDESFVEDTLAVGADRDPGIFRGADHQGEWCGWRCCELGIQKLNRLRGYVTCWDAGRCFRGR